jgi:Zn-dependent protease
MRDLLTWSVPCGRWYGVPVRLHVMFPLLAAYVLHVATFQESGLLGGPAQGDLVWYAAAALVVWLFAVVLHEAGHALMAHRLGGSLNQWLLWPFGGLSQASVPPTPRAELCVALAVPAANALACLACGGTLLALDRDVELMSLLNPFAPPYRLDLRTGGLTWKAGLELGVWVNALLLTVNALPAFPLDGARALRAMLWGTLGYRLAGSLVARGGQVAAIGTWLAAWMVHGSFPVATMPLVLLGVLLFFSTRVPADRKDRAPTREAEDVPYGYDFSQGYTSLERTASEPRPPRPGPLRRWIDAARSARRERQRQLEIDEERRADEILARLHETGLEGLTAEERSLLERVSARYRSRMRP